MVQPDHVTDLVGRGVLEVGEPRFIRVLPPSVFWPRPKVTSAIIQIVAELTLRGSMAEIQAHVQRYLEAGVDTASLYLQTLEREPARKREVIRAAIRALAPGPVAS